MVKPWQRPVADVLRVIKMTELTSSQIRQAFLNNEDPTQFDFGRGFLYIQATSWDDILKANELSEPIIRRRKPESEQYTNLIQKVEWYPIETLPEDIDTCFLVNTRCVQELVTLVRYDSERDVLIDEIGDTIPDATHWTTLPQPPRKKE